MRKKERWDLGKFPSKTKKSIQDMAKEKGMFVNDYLEEILDKHIHDEGLEKNKNFFDQRWQEVINSMELFTTAQQMNTEMWVQEMKTLNENLIKIEEKLASFEAEMIIDQTLFKKLLGINNINEKMEDEI